MTGRCGDLPSGGGYLGEIVDLPAGRVGLALFNEHGWERRIVYVRAEEISVVKRDQDRPRLLAARAQEFGQLASEHARAHARKSQDHGW